jgi:hypothetical protein
LVAPFSEVPLTLEMGMTGLVPLLKNGDQSRPIKLATQVAQCPCPSPHLASELPPRPFPPRTQPRPTSSPFPHLPGSRARQPPHQVGTAAVESSSPPGPRRQTPPPPSWKRARVQTSTTRQVASGRLRGRFRPLDATQLLLARGGKREAGGSGEARNLGGR